MSVDVRDYLERTPADGWNLPIDHWSPSSLDMLHRCPYQWQQRYIHGRKERPGESTTTGTAVHKSIESNFRQKIASKIDLPLLEVLDRYSDEIFPQTVLAEQEKNGEEVLWDTSPEAARARGRLMLGEYHHAIAPRIQPQDVELNVSVDLGLAVPVWGRADVDRDSSVIDVKTGKQTTRKPKEGWRIQAAIYGKARRKPVEFHSVSATVKTNKVTVVTPLEEEALLVNPSRFEQLEIERTIRTLSAWACFLMDTYGPDEPWPTTGRFHTWACDYCGFRAGCPAWRTA